MVGAAGIGLTAVAHSLPVSAATVKPVFRNALSISPFAEQVLASGIVFVDGAHRADTVDGLQRLFIANGASEIFARIGTKLRFTPGNGDHSVERALERAKLAAALGLPLNPELGLFASYGDITHQPEPDFGDYPEIRLQKPWHELSIADMTAALRDYGALIAGRILATGAKVNVWDIGNEVELGAAGVAIQPIAPPTEGWRYRPPDNVDPEIGRMNIQRYGSLPQSEQVAWLRRHLWPHLGAMFAAVAAGVRSVAPDARFSTHVSSVFVYSPEFLIAFFRAMREAGFEADQLGMSYYPTSANWPFNRLERMQAAVAMTAETLQRPMFLAEYGYPAGPFEFAGARWDYPVADYALSEAGQAYFLRDLAAWGLKSGHVSGIRPWAPELAVSDWGAMSLFDLREKLASARPALSAVVEGVAAAS